MKTHRLVTDSGKQDFKGSIPNAFGKGFKGNTWIKPLNSEPIYLFDFLMFFALYFHMEVKPDDNYRGN